MIKTCVQIVWWDWDISKDTFGIVNRIRTDCTEHFFKIIFQESKAIQDFHNGRLPLQTKNLDFEMVVSGPDVLKGLNSMVNSSRVSYFGPLLPKWVQEVGNRGRNVIHINDKENGEFGNSTAEQRSRNS